MNCEKCRDRGFIEIDKAGLHWQFCDCEAAVKYRAKMQDILGLPKDDNFLNADYGFGFKCSVEKKH